MVRALDEQVSFSVGLPTSAELLGPFVRRAEQLGFQGGWTQDTLSPRNFTMDALHVLSYAAGITERMRLGVSVLYALRRHPVKLARELATIDQLSGGRLTVGIGLGNAYHHEALEAVGIPTDRPVTRLLEVLGVLRALWSHGEASYDGQLYSFDDIRTQPRPVQQPGPPIWFGARVKPSLVRAVRLGDGFTGAAPTSTEDFLEHLAVVEQALDDQGRDPATFAVSKGVYVAVDDDRDGARERLAARFERSFGANPVYDARGMADRVAVFGSAEHCAEELGVLLDAGVDELILHPMYDDLDQLDAMAQVVDLVHGRAR